MSKIYSLENSPLFRLRNKRKLAKLLFASKKYLSRKHKREYIIEKEIMPNGKERCIYKPFGKIKRVQKQICKLMMRIQTPDWVMSGKKGKSYIDNAKEHIDNKCLLTVDISSFYDFVQRRKVYSMFLNTFFMEPDIAWTMTELVMVDQNLPTGSPSSMIVAYWTYKDMFERIRRISVDNNCECTVYVDDIIISSNGPISKRIQTEVKNTILKYGLRVNTNKIHYYQGTDFKNVTGVGIIKGELKVPNKKRKEIIDLFEECKKTNDIYKIERLKGKLWSLRQIEPDIFPEIYSYTKHYKSELKSLSLNRNNHRERGSIKK